MIDDDILFLWTLNGSWGWADLQTSGSITNQQWFNWNWNINYLPVYLFCYDVGLSCYDNGMFLYYMGGKPVGKNKKLIYQIDDPMTFDAGERCLRLTLAKYWYNHNKEQFE